MRNFFLFGATFHHLQLIRKRERKKKVTILIYQIYTDWASFIKAAERNRMMKVAMSSTQKAEEHPESGLVIISSDFIP